MSNIDDMKNIPIFSGSAVDYTTWAFSMEAALRIKEVWYVISGATVGNTKPKTRLSLQPLLMEEDELYDIEESRKRRQQKIAKELQDEQARLAVTAKVTVQKFTKDAERAHSMIILALKPAQQRLIRDIPIGDARGAWIRLQKQFAKTTLTSKLHVRHMLHNLRLQKDEQIFQLTSRISELAMKLEDMNSPVPEDDLVLILMRALPEKYDPIKQVLLGTDNLTFDKACERIEEYETQKQTLEQEQNALQQVSEQANYANNKQQKYQYKHNSESSTYNSTYQQSKSSRSHLICYTCKTKGHTAYECYKNKHKPKCSKCKYIGHTDEECRRSTDNNNKNIGKWCKYHKSKTHNDNECKVQQYKQSPGKSHNANYVETDTVPTHNDNDTALSAYYTNGDSIHKHNSWIIDSGASNHYTYNDKLLTNIQHIQPNKVSVASGEQVITTKVGNVNIHKALPIRDVKYVPRFNVNLLSIAKLTDDNATVTFTKDKAVITTDDKTTIEAQRENNMYVLHNQYKPNSGQQHNYNVINHDHNNDGHMPNNDNNDHRNTYTIQVNNKLQLTHLRLGHLATNGIIALAKHNAVDGIDIDINSVNDIQRKQVTKNVCEGCVYGKLHRKPFNHPSTDQPTDILDIVYADLVGQSETVRMNYHH